MKNEKIVERKLESIDVDKSREYLVVKSNQLIQRACYSLTLQQQKLICFIISLLKKDDSVFPIFEFQVNDFADLLGIERNHFYDDFRKIMLELDKKSFVLETEKEWTVFRWFSEAHYYKTEGRVRLQLHSSISEYLLDLWGNYTQYELLWVLSMSHRASPRLFELFRSWFNSKKQKQTVQKISIERIKMLLCLEEKYSDYRDFRRYMLEPSLEEINKLTDLTISYTPIKNGKFIRELEFTVTRKKFPESYHAYLESTKKINKKQRQTEGQLSFYDLTFNEEYFKNG